MFILAVIVAKIVQNDTPSRSFNAVNASSWIKLSDVDRCDTETLHGIMMSLSD